MTTRSIGKKIALGFCVVSLVCMIISTGFFAWFLATKGMMDVLTASALATSLFFASMAVTLYWISKPPQHELLPWDAPDP
jgi:hypothetical protein